MIDRNKPDDLKKRGGIEETEMAAADLPADTNSGEEERPPDVVVEN